MSIMVTVVQLCGGAFLWLAASKVPSDLDYMRRRLWGVLALYLPCKYLSVASVFCEMIYACAFPFDFAQALGKAALILRLLSFVFAFAIFLLRVNTLWRNPIIWSVTVLSQLALMSAIGLELFRIDQAYIGDSHVALVSLTLYLSTVIFTFGTLGMLSPWDRRTSRPSVARLGLTQPPSNLLHHLLAELEAGGTVSLAISWLSCVTVSSMFLALRSWSPLSRRSLCYVAWLVIIQAACRQYARLAEQKNIFLAPSLSFKWLSHIPSTDSNDEQLSEPTPECEPAPAVPSQSSSMQPWLEVDLSEVKEIKIDVFAKDVLVRRPLSQAVKTDSGPSTSASSSQLSSPVSATNTGSTSAVTPTSTSVSQSEDSLRF
ncbi:hypothetical protein L226DRAFT_540184 [Lentinus tigrinus ALCF2SS1-7]|uniref:Uncharacterized protein n=1 Tax=Lentinus tigrinus ALCF2SS1-6 TaxID=1328759 RepID=A0A5C2S323_9APHY|nr:hypothetical protein L227DRAFT_577541 [Lentinus tigrinus ALCF2SS1-6]RPD69019.1 hypothetical protein L226DRAFT_540184 [Lentinus tigrinus ALCF2SS1-7]